MSQQLTAVDSAAPRQQHTGDSVFKEYMQLGKHAQDPDFGLFKAACADVAQLRNARADLADRLRESEGERDAIRRRSRSACQRIVETIGSVGPEDVDEAAERIIAQLTAAQSKLDAIDTACLQACPDNSAAVLGEPDADIGRYLVISEDGNPLIETDDPAEVVRELNKRWWEASKKLADAQEREGRVPDVNMPMPAHFEDYIARNYPQGVVISNPYWHAPKLWGAALHALRSAWAGGRRGG